MRIKSHSAIKSTDEIKQNEIVFVLFNGLIYLGLIKEIIDISKIKINLYFKKTIFPINVNGSSIYAEKPKKLI